MNKVFLICICSFLLVHCKKKSENQKNITPISNGNYILEGTTTSYFTKKVYLNKIADSIFHLIDSAEINDNTFTFKGSVEFPERVALSFENYASYTLLILENCNFKITLNSKQLTNPIISDSPLNYELEAYKLASKRIFKQIDYLFPEFQKARLENDSEKLLTIGLEMNKIENEFTNFTFDFIEKNKNSFVSTMILRDQLKSKRIDTLRIKKYFGILSEEAKKSSDGLIIETFLNLH